MGDQKLADHGPSRSISAEKGRVNVGNMTSGRVKCVRKEEKGEGEKGGGRKSRNLPYKQMMQANPHSQAHVLGSLPLALSGTSSPISRDWSRDFDSVVTAEMEGGSSKPSRDG